VAVTPQAPGSRDPVRTQPSGGVGRARLDLRHGAGRDANITRRTLDVANRKLPVPIAPSEALSYYFKSVVKYILAIFRLNALDDIVSISITSFGFQPIYSDEP